MSSFLDKSFTVRQIFRWAWGTVLVILPLYVAAIFFNAWNLRTGGVSLNDSPFREKIPAQCSNYAQKSFGTPSGRTGLDNLLMRGRLTRYTLDQLVKNSSPLIPCLGYAVLGGLHDKTPGDANFIEQFRDVNGEPIVTVRVEYHKTYIPKMGSDK